MQQNLISRSQLAARWSVTAKTIDRLRKQGHLAWVDVASGAGRKPLVRFLIADVEAFENRNRLSPHERGGLKNG